MLTTFLAEGFFPFTLSLALFLALLVLELVFLMLGGSLIGEGADAPDIDADLDLDFDTLDVDPGEFELANLAEPEAELEPLEAAASGPLTWLGLGKIPAIIWLACVLVGFGLLGLTLQTAATAVMGRALPSLIAGAPAMIGALWFARAFGALFARLLPKTETTALSERHLGRRMGVVSQGTARRGRPAEVRVTDRHGNTHYIRAEPLRDGTEIARGARVLVLRHRREGGYFIVSIDT